MNFYQLEVHSSVREELINITPKVSEIIRKNGLLNGKVTLFVPHTTAAVTINENADPSVPRDIIFGLKKIIPHFSGFTHLEGNSDAHLKSSIIGCTQDVFVDEGRMILGTWQGIFFCEFDGPRHRRVVVGIEE